MVVFRVSGAVQRDNARFREQGWQIDILYTEFQRRRTCLELRIRYPFRPYKTWKIPASYHRFCHFQCAYPFCHINTAEFRPSREGLNTITLIASNAAVQRHHHTDNRAVATFPGSQANPDCSAPVLLPRQGRRYKTSAGTRRYLCAVPQLSFDVCRHRLQCIPLRGIGGLRFSHRKESEFQLKAKGLVHLLRYFLSSICAIGGEFHKTFSSDVESHLSY